jgi:hypothetical protein
VDPRRRAILAGAVAALGLGAPPLGAKGGLRLIERVQGGCRVLPGGAVFAAGAVAADGHEIVHAILKPWLQLDDGYALVERYLARVGRPMQALCGMELRLPRQLSVEAFRAFNRPYVERLARWGLLTDGFNPVCRTNVAPAVEAPEVPSLHGFSYTVPASDPARTFVMSGVTEMGSGGAIAAGDTSDAGMLEKAGYVVRAVAARLEELGLGFPDATQVEAYTVHGAAALGAFVVSAIGEPARRGLRWHYGRPPVTGTEIELEVRGVAREIILRS